MKRPKFAYARFFLAVYVLILMFASCSQSNPEIRSSIVQLLRIQGPAGSFAERLSFFVFFEDSDGTADFRSIVVTHNDTGLTWKILPEDSMVRLRGKDRWTGSNNLAGPGDEPLPSGNYTYTVADLAGNEDVGTFNLVRPDFPEYAPVSFSINEGRWTVTANPQGTSFTRTFLFMYDPQMKLIQSWKVPEAPDGRVENDISVFRNIAPNIASIQCYTENADGSAGVLLTPVNIE